jgi:hypothetical protein
VGQGGEMTQALYAHMNKKKRMPGSYHFSPTKLALSASQQM